MTLPSQLTGSAQDFKSATRRVVRALVESRIRGVKTNIPFLLNVLNHEDFLKGTATTRFIEEHPELMIIPSRRNRANRVSQQRIVLFFCFLPVASRKCTAHLPTSPLSLLMPAPQLPGRPDCEWPFRCGRRGTQSRTCGACHAAEAE